MNDRARRSTYCLVLIFCLFCPNSFAADCDSLPKSGSFLSYTIQPKPADGSVSLDVTVRFRLIGRKATVLVLPSEWEGQRELYHAIHDLEVVSPGSTLQPAEGPSKRRVTSAPGQMVELHYGVAKDWTGKIDASSYFRVLMESSYFQVAGRNFLVYPDLPEDEELPIRLEWKNLPQGWRVVDSLAGDSLCQAATTRLIKLTNGLFTGGELRITKVDVEGTPVFVATRGEWQFSDGSFVELAQRILTAERGFWHDIGFPNYLITLLPAMTVRETMELRHWKTLSPF